MGLWALTASVPPPEVVELSDRVADRPTVLVLRRGTANMDTFVEGMTAELDDSFNLFGERSKEDLDTRLDMHAENSGLPNRGAATVPSAAPSKSDV